MKTKLFALIFIAILFASSSLQAASKVLLRLNLQKGAIYEMTMTSTNLVDQEIMGQKMKVDQKMNMVFAYLVVDILPNKNFLIEYSIEKLNVDMNVNGQKINFDSENQDETNPASKILKDLAKIKIKLEMTPRGSIAKVEGLDLYAKELGGNPQMAQSMTMFMNEKNFGSFVDQTFNYFPENEVEIGEKWTSSYSLASMMDMKIVMNFEVAAIENDRVNLNVTSDVNMEMPIEQGGMKMNMKAKGTQNGTMSIDSNDGWIRQSDLTQKIDMNMKMKNPQTGEDIEIPIVMNAITKISVNKK
jgi:hypothetical protein